MVEGPRKCEFHDIPGIIAMVDEEMRRNTMQSVLTDYPLVYDEQNFENIMVISVDGKIVSVVPYIIKTILLDDSRITAGIISPTVTSPHHRHKGYASLCLENCIRKMEKEDVDLSLLWTMEETFPFYEKEGYQAVKSGVTSFRCTKADSDRFNGTRNTIKEFDPSDTNHIEAVKRIHEMDKSAVCRNKEDYAVLLSLPFIKTFIAFSANTPLAYLTFSEAINKPGLIEGGGDRRNLESLIKNVLMNLENHAEIRAFAYSDQSMISKIFADKMWDRREEHTDGFMIRMNNATRFIEKVKDLLKHKNESTQTAFSIGIQETNRIISIFKRGCKLEIGKTRDRDHIELSRRELVSVIFGEHPARKVNAPQYIKDFLSIDLSVWFLDRS